MLDLHSTNGDRGNCKRRGRRWSALLACSQRRCGLAVAELVAAFVAGTTRGELADQYGVSLSSVKRLLRGVGEDNRSAGGPVQ